jgi:glycerol-3-phosphate acyltransferase PlsX
MTEPKAWIAIDAMGGDFAPGEIVKGAILGSAKYQVGVLLVGQPKAIQQELDRLDTQGAFYEIVPAEEVIEMGEEPTKALRQKKDASISVTAHQLRLGKAQGMVAAGSTGAAMAAALSKAGRIKGIKRPAIAIPMPTIKDGRPCLLLDAGANADCQPFHLLQFAHMGNTFMQAVFGIDAPRVGLLNIGSEPGKGNEFSKKTFVSLEQQKSKLNWVGNIEGKDIFWGNADVAVCDGFTGNVALKSAEGIVTMVLQSIKTLFSQNTWTKLVGATARPILRKVKKKVHPEEFGGALLLGIKGICVIAHGGSSAYAIQNAIRVAQEAISQNVLDKMTQVIAELDLQTPENAVHSNELIQHEAQPS